MARSNVNGGIFDGGVLNRKQVDRVSKAQGAASVKSQPAKNELAQSQLAKNQPVRSQAVIQSACAPDNSLGYIDNRSKNSLPGSVAPRAMEGPSRPRNRLIASLPAPVWERLAPHVRHALLIPGQVLHEAKKTNQRVYFPNSGLISLAMTSRDGSQVEIGMVGREGTTCTLESLVAEAPLCRALVQIAGNACWLPLEVLRSEFTSDTVLRGWLLRYWEVLAAQSAQGALCNRLHTVEERLSRWLLLVRDRIASNEIEITHEFIAHTLGARRSGVTVALGALQQAGLIDCSRGKVTVLDGPQLEHSACECYAALSERFGVFEGAQAAAIDSSHGQLSLTRSSSAF